MQTAVESIPVSEENGRAYAEWAKLAFWLSELEANGLLDWANTSENICRLHQRAASDFQFGVTLTGESFLGLPVDLHWLADMRWGGLALHGGTLFIGGNLDWDPGMGAEGSVALGIPMDREFVNDLVGDAPDMLRLCKMTYEPGSGWSREPAATLPFERLEPKAEAVKTWLKGI